MRKEHDSMGEMQVPDNAYYSAQTQRAIENFPISGISIPTSMIRALGMIKRSAAVVNHELGDLDEARHNAIIEAADEVIAGKFDAQFLVDVFQTGSGTSSNMNTNEITEMVRKSIGVDFLGYNDAENLADAVGIPKDSMCFTCSSGNYDSLGIKPDFTKREQVKAKI